MRIAVVSDSHQGTVHLQRFVEYCRSEGIEQVFHLGDVLDDVRYLQKELQIPVAAVAGNCDMFERFQRELIINLKGKRFLLVHGDKYGVKYGYDRLSYYAEEKAADIAVFGHTHTPFIGMLGKVLLINPGALRNGSMCLIELTDGDVLPRLANVDQWYEEKILGGKNQ